LRVGDGGDDDAGDRAAWVDGVILLGDDRRVARAARAGGTRRPV
jgi:hypothetical protein